MPELSEAARPSVDAEVNFIADGDERPAYYLYETRPGFTPPPPPTVKHVVPIHDIRSRRDELTLDDNGFAVIEQALPNIDFLDHDAVVADYYPLCVETVKKHLGANRVHAFDHNVRNKPLAGEDGSGVRDPVRFAHNDYTEQSAPQRVRDLMGDEADALLGGRYVFMNVWRPLRGPVQDVPLGICDAQSIEQADFVATDLKYADRTGEIYSVRFNPAHQWCFLRHMQVHEVFLLKCFDSDGRRARYTAHSAFRDPTAPADALPRSSIEVRTIAFID